MRRIATLVPACATLVRFTANAPVEKRSKMQTLHKMLLGEIQFKNKVPLKECNIELQFGANWKTELSNYAEKLQPPEKALLNRQIARLSLTRYTTAEIAQYCGDGPEAIDEVAAAANVEQGKAFLQAKGESAFLQHVNVEAANANWSEAKLKSFIDAVKAK